VIVGYALGLVITVSISYAVLILGFSIEGSELAAILGWGILRGVMRRTSIVENNINQTIAAAVNCASPGIMFCVPALFILSKKPGLESIADINIPLLLGAAIAGCLLGLAFVIPLRKQMIDFNRLAYPGGIAVATILKSPGAGIQKALLLLGGAVLSGGVHIIVLSTLGEDAHADVGEWCGLPSMLNITFSLSVMTIGVGYLSGKSGFWFGAGGFICYLILSPLLAVIGPTDVQAIVGDPSEMRDKLYRTAGIGMLIGAALGGIIAAFPLIRSALRSMHAASKQKATADVTLRNDEMPIRLLYLSVVAGVAILVVIAFRSTPEMTLGRAVIMAVLGTLWIWVAGVIVSECVGRTNWSPLSGMTLIAVTLMMFIASAGMPDADAIVASIMVGAAVCMAVSQASDMMLDLKAGYLIGAIPRRQQFAQYIGAVVGPAIAICVMLALHNSMEIGSDRLPAPQATALATVMEGIVNDNVPVHRYAAGAGLGLLLAMSGLGGIGVLIGLGFYMPMATVWTYTIGNVLRVVSDTQLGVKFSHDKGIPLAAGLIVGEALVGVSHALIKVFGG
jgi:putative OPT family oligopeptide transporter